MNRRQLVRWSGLILGSAVALAWAQHHEHGEPAQQTAKSGLTTPQSIQEEHKHLHHQLDAALAAGGKTAERAQAVADVLLPHFKAEEAYAMPPLRLLEPLARKQPVNEGQKREAIQMAERLRREYDKMLEEHKSITAALDKLASAAREENKPDQAAFAEALILHAKNEEQVLYPATLVVGEYLELKQAGRRGQ